MPSGEPDRARHADGTWGKVDMPDCPDLKRLNFAGFAERRFRSVLSLSLSLSVHAVLKPVSVSWNAALMQLNRSARASKQSPILAITSDSKWGQGARPQSEVCCPNSPNENFW